MDGQNLENSVYPSMYYAFNWNPKVVSHFLMEKCQMKDLEAAALGSFIYHNKAGQLNSKGFSIGWLVNEYHLFVEICVRKQ